MSFYLGLVKSNKKKEKKWRKSKQWVCDVAWNGLNASKGKGKPETLEKTEDEPVLLISQHLTLLIADEVTMIANWRRTKKEKEKEKNNFA